MAGREGITAAQLASPAPYPIKYYVQNPAYWMEEKFDGCRLLVQVTLEGTVQYNRLGQETTQNRVLSGVTSPLPVLLDGELLFDTYRVFDILAIDDNSMTNLSFQVRRDAIERIVPALNSDKIILTTIARTEEQKRDLYLNLTARRAEGAMFKEITQPYQSRRTRAWLKWKFYGTIDVVISELPCDGKPESAKIMVLHHGKPITVGSVKVPMRYQKEQDIHPGDVIEVRFLNITADLKLYQPVFLRKRNGDKLPSECILLDDRGPSLPYYHGGYDESR